MNETHPLISVVIPTRDRAELLQHSLDSLADQSMDHDDYEVVVVDDGSIDRTASVCRRAAARMPLRYATLAPSGIAAAKNLGLFVAAAPIVLFFDDDDTADRELLAEHLRTHSEHPDREVAVLGRTEWSSALEVTEVMHFLTDVGCFLFAYGILSHGDVLDYTYFWGGRSSCKRLFLAREGIFDQAFRFGSEDIELGYRLSRHGFKVVYNANTVSYMERPLTYDQFCERCLRQGESQFHFGRVCHPHDPAVRAYCDVDAAEARWEAVSSGIAERMERARELERLLQSERGQAARIRTELYELYDTTFRALKLKGIVEAASRTAT